MLHGEPLELHVAAPDHSLAADTIVLYASGDGGWFGAAVDMFHQIARAGYPVVGFSSKAFLKIQRPHHGLVNAALIDALHWIVSQPAPPAPPTPSAPTAPTAPSASAKRDS